MVLRTATIGELPALEDVVARSFRALGAGHYTPAEIEGALRHRLIRVDPRLVEAGGYFVAEIDGLAVGCGGWSDAVPTVAGLPLPHPRAEVRAMFVLPEQAGRGVGRALLAKSEAAAAAAGYERAYLVATKSGYDFYVRAGYAPLGQHDVPIPGGGVIGVTCMVREIQ